MAYIAIVGPGAIGCVLAAAIRKTGRHELILCGEVPGTHKILVRYEKGEVLSLEEEIIADANAIIRTADFVFLTVKSYDIPSASNWLNKLSSPSTLVITCQNGIECSVVLRQYVKDATILPAIVWWAAQAVSISDITVTGSLNICVPNVLAGLQLPALLKGSGISVECSDEFITQSWRKICINAVAGLMAVVGCRAVLFRHQAVQEIARRLALECIRVGRAEGANLEDDYANEVVFSFASSPTRTGTSILYDRLQGHPLEWDARNGVVQRLGKQHGIPTPVSEVIVPLLAAISSFGRDQETFYDICERHVECRC